MICGILPVDKDKDITSARALAVARRLFGGVKAGHAGTLDPLATGVLPLLLGEATAFARFLPDKKEYEAQVLFGESTDTDDAKGEVVSRAKPPSDLRGRLKEVLPMFCGEIEQVAPVYSALKHRGKPMYYYARKKMDVPEKKRRVVVHEIELVSVEESHAVLRVTCGGGFYVRSLARDLGVQLGCGAHLRELRRTCCASFNVLQSVLLADIEHVAPDTRSRHVLPVEHALGHLPVYDITVEQARVLGAGGGDLLQEEQQGELMRLMVEGRFVGVGRVADGCVRGEKMLSWSRNELRYRQD